MTPDLEKLRTFFALAQTGSFTEAARRLFRTQSAVSHAIRKLEASVGLKLVTRRGRKTALTEEGQRLYDTCEQIFHHLDATFEELAERQNRPLGRLRVGATVEFGSNILMKHIQPFLATYPNIRLDFKMSHSLIEPLLKDELDIIIDCEDHPLPELSKTPLFREVYTIACSPIYQREHEIYQVADLGRAQLLSRDKRGTWWHRFSNAADGARPAPEKIIVVNHIRGMIVAAQHHMGVILVPRYSILWELNIGTLVALFPELALLEDRFSIYQKRTKAQLKRHQLLTEYLKTIKPDELGAG